RRRQTERLRRRINRHPRLNTATCKIIRIPRSPSRLSLPTTRRLARRLTASPLAETNSIVGTEPATADATGTFPSGRHDEPSSPCPVQILSCKLGYRSSGSLLESRPGSILESAEARKPSFLKPEHRPRRIGECC